MMWNLSQMSWFWPLCVITGLILLSLGIIFFSRWFSNNVDRDARQRHDDKALDLVRERFARGEITTEEFDALKRGLSP